MIVNTAQKIEKSGQRSIGGTVKLPATNETTALRRSMALAGKKKDK
jgi:hypothetical protein